MKICKPLSLPRDQMQGYIVSCTIHWLPLGGCMDIAWSMGGVAKSARTVTGSAVLLLEGLQYTGLRSGSPDTRNV